jgi:transposase InsO family protein
MQDMNEEQVNGHKGLVTIAEKVIPKAQGEAREAAANAAERAAAKTGWPVVLYRDWSSHFLLEEFR